MRGVWQWCWRAWGPVPGINFGTIASPCVVEVRGVMRGRLDRSPTQVTYNLGLAPRDGCDFAACNAVVETRWTKFDERPDGQECVLNVQYTGRRCVDCSALPDDLSCSTEQANACVTLTNVLEPNLGCHELGGRALGGGTTFTE